VNIAVPIAGAHGFGGFMKIPMLQSGFVAPRGNFQHHLNVAIIKGHQYTYTKCEKNRDMFYFVNMYVGGNILSENMLETGETNQT